MPMLTASDLTANPVSANAREPQFSAAEARWRSGYAPDCKSKADATESYEVGEVPPSFPVLDSLEKSNPLLTDQRPVWLTPDNLAVMIPAYFEGVPDPDRHVYFIGADDGGPIKIGYAKSPKVRLCMLRKETGRDLRILALRPGGRSEEAGYHLMFFGFRTKGEWFTRCPEIEAEIARLSSPIPDTLNAGGCE